MKWADLNETLVITFTIELTVTEGLELSILKGGLMILWKYCVHSRYQLISNTTFTIPRQY